MGKFLSFAFWERAFTVVALYLYSRAVLRLVLSGGASEGDGATGFDSGLLQLTFLLIYVVTAALIALRWKKVLALVSQDHFIWVLIAIATASYFWSEAPSLTMRRSIALIGTSMFGFYMASRYSLKEQLRLLGWAMGLAIVSSLLFIVALPQYGISGGIHAGVWRGVYSHKNGLGMRMALSSIVFLLLSMEKGPYRWLKYTGLGASLFLLLMAQSGTALVALMLTLAAFGIYRLLRWQFAAMFAGLSGILLGGMVAVGLLLTNLGMLLAAIGEDATLTGRADIWPVVIHEARQRPWLGYGYEAFWRQMNGPSADIYNAGLNPVSVTHAHNGLLQLWLHLGLVGVIVFIVGFVVTYGRGLRLIRMSNVPAAYLPVLWLTLLLPVNFSESTILDYNSLDWVLYISMALSVVSARREERIEAPEPAAPVQSLSGST